MEKTIQDKELGTILLRTSPRAIHYTLKISKGTITATMPPEAMKRVCWLLSAKTGKNSS